MGKPLLVYLLRDLLITNYVVTFVVYNLVLFIAALSVELCSLDLGAVETSNLSERKCACRGQRPYCINGDRQLLRHTHVL